MTNEELLKEMTARYYRECFNHIFRAHISLGKRVLRMTSINEELPKKAKMDPRSKYLERYYRRGLKK